MIFVIESQIHSVIYAIPAARPRVSSAPITLQDLAHSDGNILFFGDFANLDKGDFLEGMRELIGDEKATYDEMILNIYGLGSVLRKKFALLQVAYTAFMLALILGVSSFIGMFVWVMFRVTKLRPPRRRCSRLHPPPNNRNRLRAVFVI